MENPYKKDDLVEIIKDCFLNGDLRFRQGERYSVAFTPHITSSQVKLKTSAWSSEFIDIELIKPVKEKKKYFPIIIRFPSGETQIISTPQQIPIGVAFTVICTEAEESKRVKALKLGESIVIDKVKWTKTDYHKTARVHVGGGLTREGGQEYLFVNENFNYRFFNGEDFVNPINKNTVA